MEPSAGSDRQVKVFCDHCQSFVGRSTYYRHQARYFVYDQKTKKHTVLAEEADNQNSDSDDSIVWDSPTAPPTPNQSEDDSPHVNPTEAECESQG